MSTNYCESWFRARKIASKPLTEAQARARHNKKGALYTALLGNPTHPHTFVEIVSSDSIQVEFLDEQLRSKSAYQFVRQPDGRMFMVMAVFREFLGDGTKLRWAQRLSFKTDGHVMSFETDYVNNPHEETVVEKFMDVSMHWEPYPTFGDYASISRFDRDNNQ